MARPSTVEAHPRKAEIDVAAALERLQDAE
jgi:hypothetical protein